MFTVTVTDALSGDVEPQCIDHFATAKEARGLAALHMDDAAMYAEEASLRHAFHKAASTFRKTDAMPISITVDGLTVAVTKEA